MIRAAAIVFDIVFPEPDRTSPLRAVAALEKAGAKVELPAGGEALDNDRILARAFAGNPVVAGIAISNETSAPLPAVKAVQAAPAPPVQSCLTLT